MVCDVIKDIRPALRAFLLADPGIAAAVGGARIYPVRLPQGQRDRSLVYTIVSGVGDNHMAGPSGLARPRIQIDAWAPLIDAAHALANLVKERIDGYRGPMTSDESPPVAVDVQGVFIANEREDYQPDIELYRVGRDYLFFFGER